jgi:prophage tail gpP-like protein
MVDPPPQRVIITGGTTEAPPSDPSFVGPGFFPAAMAQSHLVSRQDLVRIDAEGNPSEIAVLVVNGKVFEDWESVWIHWSWADPFSTFRFTCAEREPYPLPGMVLQFPPGCLVDIYLGGIQVISGVIITRQVAYDPDQHIVELQGVSASWFANRSGIEHKTSDFNGKTFLQIADEILKPTGVTYQVIGLIDSTPFEGGATPGTGQTIGQFLEYLARDRNIIISNLPNGNFLFIGPHQIQTTGELIEGINIKKMQCVISLEGAWSDILVRGSVKANDQKYGTDASEQEARLAGSLNRYSILLTAVEHPVWSAAELSTRAQAEKMWNEDLTMIVANITVYGWFRPLPTVIETMAVQPIGPNIGHTLWQAGDEVIVNSPMAMLYNYPLKIKSVTWTQDNSNGTQTLLECVIPRGLLGSAVTPRKPTAPSDSTAPATFDERFNAVNVPY